MSSSVEVDYIKTTTHNYVSRKARIEGTKQVEIKGRSIIQEGVTINGDLAVIRIGRYCSIEKDSIMEPPVHPIDSSKRVPIVVGSHTRVGPNCEIHAAAIGSMVWLGEKVKLGQRCIIKDNCIIESGVEISDDKVVPPFTRVLNKRRAEVEELPPSTSLQLQEVSISNYDDFKQGLSV